MMGTSPACRPSTLRAMLNKDAIVRHVRAGLEHERRINLHRHPLKVNVVDGAVLLEGEVDSIAAKKLALEIAAAAPKIRGVVDRVRVAGEPRGDGAIRTSLSESMLREPELRTCTIRLRAKGRVETLRNVAADSVGDIEIAVENGRIALEGSVISLSHKRLAGVLAWWTPGRRDVVNSLEVAPSEEDNDAEVVEALRIVLEADPMIDPDRVTVRCRDYVVTLEGLLRSEEEKRRAEFDAWALFGVDDVLNRIAVDPLS
jgi:osmotically-inducible protein OsmY